MMVWVYLKPFLPVGSTFKTGPGTRKPGVIYSASHPGGFLGAGICAETGSRLPDERWGVGGAPPRELGGEGPRAGWVGG